MSLTVPPTTTALALVGTLPLRAPAADAKPVLEFLDAKETSTVSVVSPHLEAFKAALLQLPELPKLRDMELAIYEDALRRTNGNRALVATNLGVATKTVYNNLPKKGGKLDIAA